MSDLTITLRVKEDGSIELIDKTSDKLKGMAKASEEATKAGKDTGLSLMNIKAGADIMIGAVKQVADFASELNRAGVASRSMRESLDTLSAGRADSYISSMRSATKNLIVDLDLSEIAVKGLSLGFVDNEKQMASLTRSGAVLGKVLMNDAAGGAKLLLDIMKGVDKAEMLDNIGLSAVKTKQRFEELKKTMSDDKAWATAVLEAAALKAQTLEKSLDGAGSGVKRLETAFDNLKNTAGSNLSYLIDRTVDLAIALNSYKPAAAPQIPGIPGLNDGTMPSPENIITLAQLQEQQRKQQEFNKKYQYTYFSPQMQAGAMLQGIFGQGSLFRSDTWTGVTAAPDYDRAYREAMRMQQELNARNANRSYINSGQTFNRETMGDLYAGQAMTRFADADKFNTAQKVLGGFNNLLASGQSFLNPYAQGIEKVAGAWGKLTDEQIRRNSVQSIDQAFNIKGDGLFSEIGGGMGGAMNDRRAAVQAELEKKYGKGSKKAQSGLEAFDADQKRTAEQYQIMTGQATEASIAFQHRLEAVHKAYADGKISGDQYNKMLKDLGIAARNSNGDLETMYRTLGRSDDAESTGGVFNKRKPGSKGPGKGNYTGPQKVGSNTTREDFEGSPFSEIFTQLDGVSGKMSDISKNALDLPTKIESPMQTAAQKVKPLEVAFFNANKELANLTRQRLGFTITVTYTGSSGKGGGGGNAKGWDVR